MTISRSARNSAVAVGAIAILLTGMSAFAGRPSAPSTVAVPRVSDVLAIERASGAKLLAVGRLDSINLSESCAYVLGQEFALIAGSANSAFLETAAVGSPVALFGEIVNGIYVVDAALVLDGQYVPGASRVFLRGRVSSLNRRIGSVSIGTAYLEAASFSFDPTVASLRVGSVAAVVGTQPTISGVVLVERVSRINSARRSDIDASVGTGSPDASVGTGSPDASVGTGSPDASVGTGSPDASVGTGSAAA